MIKNIKEIQKYDTILENVQDTTKILPKLYQITHFSISKFKGNVRYIQSFLKKFRNVKTSAVQKEKRGGKNKDTFFKKEQPEEEAASALNNLLLLLQDRWRANF